MTRARTRWSWRAIATLITLSMTVLTWLVPTVAYAVTWDRGDVFVGVSSGRYQVYSNSGVLKDQINTSSSFTTGCAFDTAGNFYGTWFGANNVFKFPGVDPHNVPTAFGGGYSTPESIAFDGAGRVYVGSLGNGIRQFDASGTFIKSIIGTTRVDWFDIAADQDTILYTQEGTAINRASISSGSGLPPFSSGTVTNAFALRILNDGGLLVADEGNVKRLNAAGAVIQTYDVAGEDSWFSLNLDPNGTSFWSGNFNTANFYRFNIATGALELGPINTGTGGNTLFGICVKGEITQATQGLTLSPSTATNFTGSPHTVTATATSNGDPAPGVTVNFVVTGANTASGSCVTGTAGTCTFTYVGNNVGDDTITATAVIAGNTKTATATKTWKQGAHSLDLSPNDPGGGTAFAQAPNAAELNIVGDWTVEAWFKDESPKGYNHDFAEIVSKGDRQASGEAPYFMLIGFKTLRAGLRSNFVERSVEYNLFNGGVSANAWHHAAASFMASTRVLTLYVDGVQVAQGTLAAVSTGNSLPVSIGREGNNKYWPGKLDDVRIWNRVRTAAEIAASFQTEFGVPQPGLVGNWRFDEARGSGTTAADNATPPHDATLAGGADFSCDTHTTAGCSP